MATWKMVGWRQSLGTSGCICPSSEMMKRYERVVNFLQSAEDDFFFSFFSMGNPLLGESIISMGNMFSRIVAEGSRFTLGVWGVDLCSPDAAFMFATAQPFATVRNRPRPAAKVHTFGGAAQVVTTCKSYCKPGSS